MVDPHLLHWTGALTGLEPDRLTNAWAQVASWDFAHLERELLTGSVDGAVAATLLVEGIDHLVAHGVARTKLMAKLRGDRDVWPTWAELRAADVLLTTADDDAEITLEAGRSGGAHADMRF